MKSIGTAARKEIQFEYDKKVFLELWVKVKKKWTDDVNWISQLGYDLKKYENQKQSSLSSARKRLFRDKRYSKFSDKGFWNPQCLVKRR